MAESSDRPLPTQTCDGRPDSDVADMADVVDSLHGMGLQVEPAADGQDADGDTWPRPCFEMTFPPEQGGLMPYNPEDFQPTFLSNNSEVTIDSELPHYVHTDDMDDAVDALETHGRVVLCGPPGSGKTALGHALLRRYRQRGFKPYVMAHVHDWHVHIGEGRRSVVLMDGTLGEEMVDRSEYRQWRAILRCAHELSKSRACLLVLTVYPHVLRELRVLDAGTYSPLMESVVVVHVMRHALDVDIKTDMLATHLRELQLPTTEQDALVAETLRKDVSGAAFPWCCGQLAIRQRTVSQPTDTYEGMDESTPVFNRAYDPIDIFTAPSECYVPLLQRMFTNKDHGKNMAAVTSLTMMGLGRFLHHPGGVQSQLEALGFHHTCEYDLEAYAAVLKGLILKEVSIGFCSRVMYDAVGLALGRSFSLPVLLKVCDVTFLVQHVRTEETGKEFSVIIGPSPAERHFLMQAIYEHLVNGRLPEVCQHPALHCPQFLAEFETFCRDHKNYLQRVLSALDTVHKMPLLYWSVWGPSGNLTHWCLHLAEGQTHSTTQTALLVRVALACVWMVKTTDGEACGQKTLLNIVTGANGLRDMTDTETDLPVPSKDQCITEDLRAMRSQLIRDLQDGCRCYLGDLSLPIPRHLLRVEITSPDDSDKVHVVVDSKQWYLALRLVSDRQVDERDENGNTLLHVAAHTGHLDAVKMAVKSGASLTATNKSGLTPTQLAANRRTRKGKKAESQRHDECDIDKAYYDGDLDRVKVLLCTEATVQDKYGLSKNSPLHWACLGGQTDIAALLIGLETEVNGKNDDERTPLHSACMKGHTQTAQLLIQHLADVGVIDKTGWSPLHSACKEGHTQTAQLLIQHHADVNVKDNRGSTPLHSACVNGHTQTALLLIQNRADVNVKDSTGRTPLHSACMEGQTQTALLLIQHHADVNVEDAIGITPLHYVCMMGQTQTALLLIQHHADVNVKGDMGRTPLHYACIMGHTQTALLLIQHRADVNVKDSTGRTPLLSACMEGQTQTALLLIQHHADVNVEFAIGITPLHSACMMGRTQTAQFLIQHHADVNLKGSTGRTPLHSACMEGQIPAALLLIQHHADVNVKGDMGHTPLHYACIMGHTQTALLLIQHHADVNAKDITGCTPLHYACVAGQTQTALLLIQHHADVNANKENNCTPLDVALHLQTADAARLLIQHGATVKSNSLKHKKLTSLGIPVPVTSMR